MLKRLRPKRTVNNLSFLQIFISYSRKDKDLVALLDTGLKQKDYKVWLDTKDILPSTQWMQMILDAIEQSPVFLMVISADSLYSEVCLKELNHAAALGKKIIPLVTGNIKEMKLPEEIRSIQWVSWVEEDGFTANMDRLYDAILVDLDWHIQHTTIAAQTVFWKKNNETKDILLRGNMLLNAEAWIDDSYKDKKKLITDDQKQFILKSRKYIARKNLLPLLNGLVLVIAFSLIIQVKQSPLKTPASPMGILSLELAMNRENTNQVLAAWKSMNLTEDASMSVMIDFAFIYTYLLFFIFSLKYFKTYFKRRKKILSKIAAILITLVAIVAFFDTMENVFLLIILDGNFIPSILFLSIVSTLKFTFLSVCLLYLLLCLIYSSLFRKRIEAIEVIH